MKTPLLETLYRLKFITRYSNIERVRDESVAEHSFYVASIVLELSEKYEFDVGIAVTMAITHDWPESVIDDISHKIKQNYPAVRKALKEAELEVVKEYPKVVREAFIGFEAGITVEAKIVALADVMQCLQYAEAEMRLGNHGYMANVQMDSIQRIAILEADLIKWEK